MNCCAHALTGVWLLAGLIGTAAGVIEEMNSEDRDRKESVDCLDRLLVQRAVPDELRRTLRTYFLYQHDRLLTPRYHQCQCQ